MGDFSQAITLLQATLPQREQVLGSGHLVTLQSRRNLTNAYEAAQAVKMSARRAASAIGTPAFSRHHRVMRVKSARSRSTERAGASPSGRECFQPSFARAGTKRDASIVPTPVARS